MSSAWKLLVTQTSSVSGQRSVAFTRAARLRAWLRCSWVSPSLERAQSMEVRRLVLQQARIDQPALIMGDGDLAESPAPRLR